LEGSTIVGGHGCTARHAVASKNIHEIIAQINSAETGGNALVEWSSLVEKAVDRSLQLQHRMDPVRHPIKCLPDVATGRRRGLDFRRVRNGAVKNDKFGGYNPSCEIFKAANTLKIRQVRRIKSLIRALEAFYRRHPGDDIYSDAQVAAQFQGEWDKILRAKGFGSSWKSWVLSFEAFSVVPFCVPSLDQLYEFDQLTVFACEASCNQESMLRRKHFQSRISIDATDHFGSMSYSIIKAKDSKKLTEVPFRKSAKLVLQRLSKVDERLL
jgi:hypothetical protein